MRELMAHLDGLRTTPITFMVGIFGFLMMAVGSEHSGVTQNICYSIGFASLLVGWLKTSEYFSTCRYVVRKLHYYSAKKNVILLAQPMADVSNVEKSISEKTKTVINSYKNYTSLSLSGGMFEWLNRLVFYCGFVVSIGSGSVILSSISAFLMTNHLTGVIMMNLTINKLRKEYL